MNTLYLCTNTHRKEDLRDSENLFTCSIGKFYFILLLTEDQAQAVYSAVYLIPEGFFIRVCMVFLNYSIYLFIYIKSNLLKNPCDPRLLIFPVFARQASSGQPFRRGANEGSCIKVVVFMCACPAVQSSPDAAAYFGNESRVSVWQGKKERHLDNLLSRAHHLGLTRLKNADRPAMTASRADGGREPFKNSNRGRKLQLFVRA